MFRKKSEIIEAGRAIGAWYSPDRLEFLLYRHQ
jgi:hypothetical protein